MAQSSLTKRADSDQGDVEDGIDRPSWLHYETHKPTPFWSTAKQTATGSLTYLLGWNVYSKNHTV